MGDNQMSAGWYPDPWDREAVRWWDGAAWCASTRTGVVPEQCGPRQSMAPAGARRRALAIAGALLVVAACGGTGYFGWQWLRSEVGSSTANAQLSTIGNPVPHSRLSGADSTFGDDLCYFTSCIEVYHYYAVGGGERFLDARSRVETRLRARGYGVSALWCDDTATTCWLTGTKGSSVIDVSLVYTAIDAGTSSSAPYDNEPRPSRGGSQAEGFGTPPRGDPVVTEIKLSASNGAA